MTATPSPINECTTPNKRFHNMLLDLSQTQALPSEERFSRLDSRLKPLATPTKEIDELQIHTPPRIWLVNQTPSPSASSVSSLDSSSSIPFASTMLPFSPTLSSDSIINTNSSSHNLLPYENSTTSIRHTKKLKLDAQGRSKKLLPLITDLDYRQEFIDSPLELSSRLLRSWTPPTPSSPASSSGDSYASASSFALSELPFDECNIYTESSATMEHGKDLSIFPQSCPEDILLCIFRHLDDLSLCRTLQVCKSWRYLIKHYENWLWSHLSRRDWHHTEKVEAAVGWKNHYRTHKNLHQGNYRFQSFRINKTFSDNLEYRLNDSIFPTPQTAPRSYVMAWPVDPADAYIVALAGDQICWIDVATPEVIHIVRVEPIANILDQQLLDYQGQPAIGENITEVTGPSNINDTIPKSILQPIAHLRGHRHPIGLILSNGEGTLVSFDDSSTIIVWDVVHHQFEREIRAHDHLGFIFSMNVHHRSIVTGGRNGKIIVWSADTGEALICIDIPNKYLEHLNVFNLLNVAIWEDYIAYGLYDGTFYVFDMKQKKQLYSFNTAGAIAGQNDEPVTNSALAPMTLAINGHIILTNGPRMDQLAGWDVATGELLYILSEPEGIVKDTNGDDMEDDEDSLDGELDVQNPGDNGLQPTDQQENQPPAPVQQQTFELKFAEISRDASLIFGSVTFEGQMSMLAWDFRGDRSHTRRMEKRIVQGEGRLVEFWLCFDEL